MNRVVDILNYAKTGGVSGLAGAQATCIIVSHNGRTLYVHQLLLHTTLSTVIRSQRLLNEGT